MSTRQKAAFIILINFALLIEVNAEPYKPYPIIFVHGLGSNSATWGAEAYKEGSMYTDSIDPGKLESGHTYDHFLNYMNPYAIEWDKVDKSYTKPGDVNNPPGEGVYPNKTFLEVVNMDDPWGSVDDDYSEFWPFTGRGYESSEYSSWVDELHNRVVEVLEEYYGDGWGGNSEAKVIIIGHSTGAPAAREMLRVHSDIVSHVHQLITVNGVNEGSWLATPTWQAPGEFYNTRDWVFLCFTNTPLWPYRWEISLCKSSYL